MTLEERAQEIVGKYIDQHVSNGICEPLATHVLSDLIENALRTVRDEALEEAAKTADARRNNVNVPVAMAADDTAKIIGEDIRSLKSEVSREREMG